MSNGKYFVDLSNNNDGTFDAKAYKAAGHRGVVLKASQGVGEVDSTFHERYVAAKHVGLWVGAYHFADGSGSATDQAKHFDAVIGHLPVDERILDVEQGGKLADPVAFVQDFNKALPITWLYSDLGYLEQYGQRLLPYGFIKVWAAAFPNLTEGWWTPHLVAHQYADDAHVKGVVGACDISVLS